MGAQARCHWRGPLPPHRPSSPRGRPSAPPEASRSAPCSPHPRPRAPVQTPPQPPGAEEPSLAPSRPPRPAPRPPCALLLGCRVLPRPAHPSLLPGRSRAPCRLGAAVGPKAASLAPGPDAPVVPSAPCSLLQLCWWPRVSVCDRPPEQWPVCLAPDFKTQEPREWAADSRHSAGHRADARAPVGG